MLHKIIKLIFFILLFFNSTISCFEKEPELKNYLFYCEDDSECQKGYFCNKNNTCVPLMEKLKENQTDTIVNETSK